MSSGVAVDPACATIFNEVKLRHTYRYIIYALKPDLTEITVLKLGSRDSTFDDFVNELLEAQEKQECRYAVYDVDFQLNDGQHRSKLVFYLWSPENAKVKQKLVYTTSKQYIKRALVGIGREVQACDRDDLMWTTLVEDLRRGEVANN